MVDLESVFVLKLVSFIVVEVQLHSLINNKLFAIVLRNLKIIVKTDFKFFVSLFELSLILSELCFFVIADWRGWVGNNICNIHIRVLSYKSHIVAFDIFVLLIWEIVIR